MYSIYTFNTLKKWELTAGIIVNTFISEEMVESPEGGIKKMYKPNIKYEYMADDVKYYHNDVNTIPNFNKYYGSMKDAQNYLNNYKIGENIDILYNKNNPEHSMLKNKIYEIRLFLTILSFSFFLIGIMGLLLFNKYYKSRQH
jgi:ABC-type antimicrobial peptide transport system permease subunit